MRKSLSLIAIILCFLCSGCLNYEKVSTKIIIDDSGAGRLEQSFEGLDSTETEDKKIHSDYEDLMAAFSDEQIQKEKEDHGIEIVDWQTDVNADGKVFAAFSANFDVKEFLSKNEEYQIINGEFIAIVNKEEGFLLESNGTLFETEKNYIMVWPNIEGPIQWLMKSKEIFNEPSKLRKFFKKE